MVAKHSSLNKKIENVQYLVNHILPTHGEKFSQFSKVEFMLEKSLKTQKNRAESKPEEVNHNKKRFCCRDDILIIIY